MSLKHTYLLLLLCIFQISLAQSVSEPIVLGYFPSWQENYTTADQPSKLRDVPAHVNYVFLAFAKPDLTYTKGSYDISGTGIEVPYDGCTLKESVSALKDKGTQVILSVGGETYWTSSTIYNNIDYQAIKDLVDDMGFVGIDWDFEPNGSFAEIGTPENVQHFIDFFNNSRALMPRNEGYLLACAPSGIGALGGLNNDDPTSPWRYDQRNVITGENDDNLYNFSAQTNGINLYGFAGTGHMIPVIQAVGDKIDMIAYQGYNIGASLNRSIMFDAYAYYAEQYGFHIAAGIHFPDEPWGPHYEYTHQTTADLTEHIANHPDRTGKNDGIMIWQLLLEDASSSAYNYMHIASQVLDGIGKPNAIANAANYTATPYTGGAEKCGGSTGGGTFCGASSYNENNAYPTPDTEVYYDCAVWKNQWYANPGEKPNDNPVWVFVSDCFEEPACGGATQVSLSGCDSVVSPSNNYIWTTSGVYADTIPSSTGGDSALSVTVEIFQSTNSSITVESCTDYITPSGTQTLTISGVYTDTIPNFNGCDSVITIEFQKTTATTDTTIISSCASYRSPSGKLYTATGIYQDTIFLSNGCEQYFYIDYTLLTTVKETVTVDACNEYRLASGKIIYSSGTYIDTLASQNGCDSIITQEVTISELDAIAYLINDTLFASPEKDAYQWISCSPAIEAISGAMEHFFVPTKDGEYAAVVTENGCTDTTDCIRVIVNDVTTHVATHHAIQLVENRMVFSNHHLPGQLIVINSIGKSVAQIPSAKTDSKTTFEKPKNSGIYTLIFIDTKGTKWSQKIYIERE